MKKILIQRVPVSQNNRRGKMEDYAIDLVLKFAQNYTPVVNHYHNQERLYGIVYNFSNNQIHRDADNISKPVWDALQHYLYENDYQIKLRYAGRFCRDHFNDIALELNIDNFDQNILDQIIRFYANQPNGELIYIEIGNLYTSNYITRFEDEDN